VILFLFIRMENASQLKSKTSTFENSLKTKYPQIEDIGMYLQNNGALYIAALYIKEEFRGKGIGSMVMNDIVAFADANKLPIVLIPESEDLKTKVLLDFYKKFGFKPNHGRHKDYTLSIPMAFSMYRLPKG